MSEMSEMSEMNGISRYARNQPLHVQSAVTSDSRLRAAVNMQ
jgi:hypothetical protein